MTTKSPVNMTCVPTEIPAVYKVNIILIYSLLYPCTDLDEPRVLQEVEASMIFRESAQVGGKVLDLMHRPPLPPRKDAWYFFLLEVSRPQGHSSAGRIIF
jgi:hypothetical protein